MQAIIGTTTGTTVWLRSEGEEGGVRVKHSGSGDKSSDSKSETDLEESDESFRIYDVGIW